MNEIAAWTGMRLEPEIIGFESADERREKPAAFTPDADVPCIGCPTAARCARESLACCAYGAYSAGWEVQVRSAHREPSREWYEFSERETECRHEKRPHCADCAGMRPNTREKPAVEMVYEMIALTPGIRSPDIAQALRLSPLTVRRATARLVRERRVERTLERHRNGNTVTHILRWKAA